MLGRWTPEHIGALGQWERRWRQDLSAYCRLPIAVPGHELDTMCALRIASRAFSGSIIRTVARQDQERVFFRSSRRVAL